VQKAEFYQDKSEFLLHTVHISANRGWLPKVAQRIKYLLELGAGVAAKCVLLHRKQLGQLFGQVLARCSQKRADMAY
jgi:hypothetical protein